METTKRTIAEKSSDTALIESMFNELSVGDVLEYEKMSTALGRDARKHCRHNIQSAKRSCESRGIVLAAIPGVGYKRLDSHGIVEASSGDRKRVSRLSKRALRKLASVKFEELSNEEKASHTAASAQFGAINHFSSVSTQKKLAKVVEDKKTWQVSLGDTLKMFVE